MCIFTGRVEIVSKTRIFVGDIEDNKHCCVYSMSAEINTPLAMVLPVPNAEKSLDALEFVNLEEYPKFFDDLENCFEKPRTRGMSKGLGDMACAAGYLAVHDVGKYVASFVPMVSLFGRLDPMFRLPYGVISALKGYKDFGYAVFQLKDQAGKISDFHPMAFKYIPKNQNELFFPTVHVHDGKGYFEQEDYDHTLYAQPETFVDRTHWIVSDYLPSEKVNIEKVKGLVNPGRKVLKTGINGHKPNMDYFHDRDSIYPKVKSPV